MLHAKSGMKKGPPVNMAKELVQPVNVRIITGRSSIQGILKKLGQGQSQPGGKIDKGSSAFICSSELTSSIVDDAVATKLLTDLYDRNYNTGDWESLLKVESFKLNKPTVSMLTATNDAMAEDFLTKSAVQGGYIARTFLIYAAERQAVNSLIYDLHSPPNYKTSADYLKELSKLSGPFHPMASNTESTEYRFKTIKHGREVYFNEVGSIYDEWYERFIRDVGEQEISDETGTLNRFGDSVLKVAMLLSLARHPKLELIPEAMQEAIHQCESLVGNIRKATLGRNGASSSAQFRTLIMLELLNRNTHQASRQGLMQKFWMHFGTPNEFDDTMEVLRSAGYITVEPAGTQLIYTMPPERVEEFKKFMKGKN